MKKKILFGLSLVAVATLSVRTTVAFLASETETLVNTMTAGNVSIEQLEYERKVEDGKWVASEPTDEWLTETGTDRYGYLPDRLQLFTQDKMLVPAVYADGAAKWDDRNGSEKASGEGSHQQSWAQVGVPGSNQLFDDSVKNVIDKFVFVKNTGNNDAYVRTWIAFEQGNLPTEKQGITSDNPNALLHLNQNYSWWNKQIVANNVVIADENGVESKYLIICYTFKGEDSSKTGILTPDAITRPSLLQVFLDPSTTNEDIKAIDGNNNGKYDVLVVSQASQAVGYDSAEASLTAAFGEVTAENHPFFRVKTEN